MSLQRPLVHFFASAVGLSSPAISAGLALTAGVSASPALMVSATSALTPAINGTLNKIVFQHFVWCPRRVAQVALGVPWEHFGGTIF